jgi:hypothetical protein
VVAGVILPGLLGMVNAFFGAVVEGSGLSDLFKYALFILIFFGYNEKGHHCFVVALDN